MKRKLSFLLTMAIAMACLLPQAAFAANETTGSTEVVVDVPFANVGVSPSYSYELYIPARINLEPSGGSFQIAAAKMDIPSGKEVVVHLNGTETFESDGSFYLFLNGDKNSDHWILCNIFRIQGSIESAVMGSNPTIASFSSGALKPYNCDSIRIQHTIYNDGVDLEPGTYSGIIYYSIYLE